MRMTFRYRWWSRSECICVIAAMGLRPLQAQRAYSKGIVAARP